MRQSPTAKNASAGRVVALFVRPIRQGRRLMPQESELKGWIIQRRAEWQPQSTFRWYRATSPGRGTGGRAWEQLVRDIQADRISVLVCWRLDRLGRTCSELVKLIALLAEHQVNLISVKDQFDLSTPEGKRVANTLASVALYESESRSERILTGQAAAGQGCSLGRLAEGAPAQGHARAGNPDQAASCAGHPHQSHRPRNGFEPPNRLSRARPRQALPEQARLIVASRLELQES